MLVIMVVQKEKKETLVARTQSSASNGFSKTISNMKFNILFTTRIRFQREEEKNERRD